MEETKTQNELDLLINELLDLYDRYTETQKSLQVSLKNVRGLAFFIKCTIYNTTEILIARAYLTLL